ncbi:unnamed protein product, partial [Polarella glacialis]
SAVGGACGKGEEVDADELSFLEGLQGFDRARLRAVWRYKGTAELLPMWAAWQMERRPCGPPEPLATASHAVAIAFNLRAVSPKRTNHQYYGINNNHNNNGNNNNNNRNNNNNNNAGKPADYPPLAAEGPLPYFSAETFAGPGPSRSKGISEGLELARRALSGELGGGQGTQLQEVLRSRWPLLRLLAELYASMLLLAEVGTSWALVADLSESGRFSK